MDIGSAVVTLTGISGVIVSESYSGVTRYVQVKFQVWLGGAPANRFQWFNARNVQPE